LQRALELEEEERINMNEKSVKLLEEIKKQAEMQKRLREEEHK
jgi:hypothetical protein